MRDLERLVAVDQIRALMVIDDTRATFRGLR